MVEKMRGDKKEFKWTHGENRSFKISKKKVKEIFVLDFPNISNIF